MADRGILLSMGFSAERVDWALRDTPPEADLQARLDHIFAHEDEPISSSTQPPAPSNASEGIQTLIAPSEPPDYRFPNPISVPTGGSINAINTSSASSAFRPPSHPPPGFNQPLVPPPTSNPQSPQPSQSPQPPQINPPTNLTGPNDLVRTLGDMNIRSSHPVYSPPAAVTSSAPAPDCANPTDPIQQSLQRYNTLLNAQTQDVWAAKQGNAASATRVYTALQDFFRREMENWSAVLNIPVPPPVTSSSMSIGTTGTSSIAVESPPVVASTQAVTAASPSNGNVNDKGSSVYDPVSIYYSNRTLLLPSSPLAEVLKSVIAAYSEDKPVEDAVKKARVIQPRLSDKVAELRWRTISASEGSGVYDDGYSRRAEEYSQQIRSLSARGQWEAIASLEESYKQQEKRMLQDHNQNKYQKYRQAFLDPARESIHAAFKDLHPIAAELQKFLEEDNRELDVLRACRALEEVSDMMELGVQELETLDDDATQREFTLQRDLVKDNPMYPQPWEEWNRMDEQKKMKDIEIRASRATQKVQRRTLFFNLVTRRLQEAIAGVDKDRELLINAIQAVHATLPNPSDLFLSLEEEEARMKTGDSQISRTPLPSKELYNQLYEAQSSLLSINKMAQEMRLMLKNYRQKHINEVRDQDRVQLELNETRAGRGDSWSWTAGNTFRERGEREDEETERAFSKERDDRTAEFETITRPFSTFLTKYKDREGACLKKLAAGMDVNGPMTSPSASSIAATASSVSTNAELQAMQQLLLQQQQVQMSANMMWLQHWSGRAMVNLV